MRISENGSHRGIETIKNYFFNGDEATFSTFQDYEQEFLANNFIYYYFNKITVNVVNELPFNNTTPYAVIQNTSANNINTPVDTYGNKIAEVRDNEAVPIHIKIGRASCRE